MVSRPSAVLDWLGLTWEISLLANSVLLQRPEYALDSVAVRLREEPNPNLELITVHATIEMGCKEEVMGVVSQIYAA